MPLHASPTDDAHMTKGLLHQLNEASQPDRLSKIKQYRLTCSSGSTSSLTTLRRWACFRATLPAGSTPTGGCTRCTLAAPSSVHARPLSMASCGVPAVMELGCAVWVRMALLQGSRAACSRRKKGSCVEVVHAADRRCTMSSVLHEKDDRSGVICQSIIQLYLGCCRKVMMELESKTACLLKCMKKPDHMGT